MSQQSRSPHALGEGRPPYVSGQMEIVVDWSHVLTALKTEATIIANPFRPIPSASPPSSQLNELQFSLIRELNSKYVRWHLINAARHVVAKYPPTDKRTFWDFSLLDEDMIPFLDATRGQDAIINFTVIPYWMFKSGQPVPEDNNLDDPNILRRKYLQHVSKPLRDPTGRELGQYFARIVSWYTRGGFTDENDVYHHSGYRYELPWIGVLNELDACGEPETVTPEQYTHYYDSIVSAVREVSPETRFVGLSNGLPSLMPEYFEYFLNPQNHRPGIPLDMVAYHFYAGGWGLGGSGDDETIENWQYSFFNQAAGFLSTVLYIESIRKRLSPATKVNLDEVGAFLRDDVTSEGYPERAKPIPELYWNLNGAIIAYVYIELAKMNIDVVTASGIYDRPHGCPGYIPSITYIDPATGVVRAPIRVLQLIRNSFAPGDKLVSTDPPGSRYSLISGSDVAAQAMETSGGRKLLLINKRLHPAEVELAGVGRAKAIRVVDDLSKDEPWRNVKISNSALVLRSFAVAVVDFE